MKRNRINIERVVSIVSFLYLVMAFYGSYKMNGDVKSIIPNSKIVICTVHAICSILALFCVIKPIIYIQIFILFTESCLTILTDYEILGIFFYYCAVILLLCKGLFTKKADIHATILFILHIITILLMYPHGLIKTLIALASSVFFLVFYMWIYEILKAKFFSFIPENVRNNSVLVNKQPGSELHLSSYNLTERQIEFTICYMKNNYTYTQISKFYNVSLSTVKKDFAVIFKIFNVTKLEELHILLLQFQISK